MVAERVDAIIGTARRPIQRRAPMDRVGAAQNRVSAIAAPFMPMS
jgi:hypothetical protein